MITFKVPEWSDGRICVQLVPDRTGKNAVFQDTDGSTVSLPVIGWATVLVLEDGLLPRVSFEPVVDEECFGPIALGCLYAEGAGLELIEVT
ncbi:hypothetical protein ABZ543_12870 [Streptomyces roseifaciens]